MWNNTLKHTQERHVWIGHLFWILQNLYSSHVTPEYCYYIFMFQVVLICMSQEEQAPHLKQFIKSKINLTLQKSLQCILGEVSKLTYIIETSIFSWSELLSYSNSLLFEEATLIFLEKINVSNNYYVSLLLLLLLVILRNKICWRCTLYIIIYELLLGTTIIYMV